MGLGDTLGVLPPECGGTGVTYADGNMYAYFDTIPTLYAGTSVKRVVHQSAKEIDENAFKDCTKLTEVVAPSVTKIGDSAFSGCASLTSFSSPNVTSLGSSAFIGCASLTSVSLPKVTGIPASSFKGLANLASFDSRNVSSVGANAFEGCKNLKSMDLSSATTIGNGAFSGCSNLSTVKFNPNGVSLNGSTFSNSGISGVFEVPDKMEVTSDSNSGGDFAGCKISGIIFKDGSRILTDETNKYNKRFPFSGVNGLKFVDFAGLEYIGYGLIQSYSTNAIYVFIPKGLEVSETCWSGYSSTNTIFGKVNIYMYTEMSRDEFKKAKLDRPGYGGITYGSVYGNYNYGVSHEQFKSIVKSKCGISY